MKGAVDLYYALSVQVRGGDVKHNNPFLENFLQSLRKLAASGFLPRMEEAILELPAE